MLLSYLLCHSTIVKVYLNTMIRLIADCSLSSLLVSNSFSIFFSDWQLSYFDVDYLLVELHFGFCLQHWAGLAACKLAERLHIIGTRWLGFKR